MKTIKYFLFALAGLSLFACSKDDSIQGQEDSKPVSISVSLGGLGTRATAPSDIFTSDTLNVNSVLINLTNASGVVIVSKTITKDAALDSDWDKLTNPAKGLKFINIPESIAKVYAYGNPGSAVTNNVINTTLASQQGSGVL